MDLTVAITKFEAALDRQTAVALAPEVQEASRALRAGLEPAVRELALSLAEQAALEVASQLPRHSVDVVLEEGAPTLRVSEQERLDVGSEPLDARITLRLPPRVKELVEDAAEAKGESLNSFLVRFLSSTGRSKGGGFDGELRT